MEIMPMCGGVETHGNASPNGKQTPMTAKTENGDRRMEKRKAVLGKKFRNEMTINIINLFRS